MPTQPPLMLAPLAPPSRPGQTGAPWPHRPALEAFHAALFPVDYEPAFYDAVEAGHDGVFSFGLFEGRRGGGGGGGGPPVLGHPPPPPPVAFVTARAVPWGELSTADLAVLGLTLPPGRVNRDGVVGGGGGGPADVAPSPPVAAVYVLTLGVPSPTHRRFGAGRALMAAVATRAAALGAGAVYLHVAAFNTPALAFYRSLGRGEEGGAWSEGGLPPPPPPPPPSSSYRLAATLPSFYAIPKRPPIPGVTRYDAHLLVRAVGGEEGGGRGGGGAGQGLPFPPPAWAPRSPLASPPLAPPLPPADGVGVGGVGLPAPAMPTLPPTLAALAAWARRAWAALPPAPAWARDLFGGSGRSGRERRGKVPDRLPPVVMGDII